ncbi:MAG: asparagine synthase-related protein [Roseateles sp.]|uniref:asparagine synthase-related protein n=1 Tax=Roseateles sp. TaxID=1971397 RepID=UPI004035E2B7
MFRYIAFSWAAANEGQNARARALAEALIDRGWHRAFSSAGFSVYVVGRKRGVNDVYLLPSHAGVVLGRLFRRADQSPAAGKDTELTDREGDEVVRSDGRTLVEQFWGRWVAFLACWTGESRVLRDPTGTLPCFHMETEGLSVVFSWLEDVYAVLELPPPQTNWDAVAAVLVYGRLGARETALTGVTQVLPGELTSMRSPGGEIVPVWRAVDIARRPIDPQPGPAARMLRDETTQSVRSWMTCYEDIVLRLSGGVDSAIILGSFFCAPPTASITCLNYFSEGSDSDERAYARLAASRAGCALVERHRDIDFHLKQVMDPALTPIPGSHIGRLGSDRMDTEVTRAVGASVLFTGAGGDQLFEEVRCTWPAADYLQLRGLDRGFPAATLDAARLGHVSFWQTLREAFQYRFGKRSALTNAGQYLALMPSDAVDGALRQAPRFVHPGLLEGSDLPIGKLMQLRALICPFDYYNPYGPATSPELVHPLMSQPLLELSLKLPTYVLTRGGRGRALARDAFADRIPAEIASRRSKGGTEEHITAVLQRSLPLVRRLLLDGQLVQQGLLERQRLEASLERRPAQGDAYVSEIHSCIAIEAWLGRVASDRRTPLL